MATVVPRPMTLPVAFYRKYPLRDRYAVLKPAASRRSNSMLFAVVLALAGTASCCPDKPEITLPPVDVEADLGETVSFVCQAQASTSLFWTVNGKHFTHSNDFIELLETAVLNESSCLMEGRLNVRALPPVDNTTIVCVALSSLTLKPAPSSPVKITVIGTAAVSKEGLRIFIEPDEPDILSRSVESVVASGYQNLIGLEWQESFTSDDPASLQYNVSITNKEDQYHQGFEATLNTTSTNLPPQIMTTCCNYTIAVTALTKSHTANRTTVEVECLGYPDKLQTFEVAVEVIQDNFSVTFKIEVPDPDCMNVRISNVTVLIDDLSSSNATEKFGPIATEGLEGEVLQYSINDLIRNSHFETAVIATNKFGSSVSAIAVKFSSHDVQNVSWTVSGNTLNITCVMAKGSQARGCSVKLTTGQVVKVKNFTAVWSGTQSEASGKFTLDKSGSYSMTVYDIEDNGDISNSSAWSETIDVVVPHSTSSIHVRSTSNGFPMATVDLGNEPEQSGTSNGLCIGLISGGVVILLIVVICIIGYTLYFLRRKCRKSVTVAVPSPEKELVERPCLVTPSCAVMDPATTNIRNRSESSLTTSTSTEPAISVKESVGTIVSELFPFAQST